MAQILLPSLRRLVLTALASAAMVLLGALLLTVSPPAAHAVASPSPPAVAPVEPATLDGRSEDPTMEIMKEVCRPVGMKAAAIGKENGWQVRQVAAKYRNPDPRPTPRSGR